jgi:hypothetical protein
MIHREFQYPVSADIRVSRWKDTPTETKAWAFSIWAETFGTQRTCMGDDDLLLWMPGISTLTAKHGTWIGDTRSFYAVYVGGNYVDPAHRGKGISGRMILTMANEATRIWGPIPFLFELQTVPPGLRDVQPILRFSYVWIPFANPADPPRWKEGGVDIERGYPGFHVDSTEGYRCFSRGDQRILLDSLNDIIYYTDVLSLPTFDGMPLSGAWCRVFHPWGSVRVFLHNMYHDLEPSLKHHILT